MKLVTPCGQRSTFASDGPVSSTTTTFTFGTELLLPLDDPSAVIHVRVLNDDATATSKPTLLGQWVMTAKYLIVMPSHCKHSALRVHKDGSCAGTFLLSDAGLHGSAVRGFVRGPSPIEP